MRELVLLSSLFQDIEDHLTEKGAKRATRIVVSISPLATISAAKLQTHFNRAKSGTVAEDAIFEIHLSSKPEPPAQDLALLSLEME